jgi:uncharacterized protein YgiM (DUF1202 family)
MLRICLVQSLPPQGRYFVSVNEKIEGMMKLLIVITLLLSSHNSKGQSIGDTLFVAAKSSLNLRKQPGINSRIVMSLESNYPVQVAEVHQLDTIDHRISNWVKVETADNDSGFVFGGYLNRRPLPDEKFSSITHLLNFIIDYHSLIVISKFSAIPHGHKETYRSVIYQGKGIYIISAQGYEWGVSDIFLDNYNLNEALNLINGFEWEGVNPEYEELVKSATRNLKRFQYIIGHDDPEREVTLEEGLNNRLRIQIKE